MQLQIEPMTAGDAEAVLALWRECEGVGLRGADSPEGLARYLARNPGLSLVAREDGRIVGAALCGHDGRNGYLHHVAVARSHQRRGIGRALAERCLAALAELGIERCHLFVHASNEPGLAFWRALNWKRRDEVVMMTCLLAPGDQNPSQ